MLVVEPEIDVALPLDDIVIVVEILDIAAMDPKTDVMLPLDIIAAVNPDVTCVCYLY